MKRLIALVVLVTVGTMAFARGAREQMTEEEALVLIDQKIAELQLTLEESEASEQAFLAIVAAGARIKQALTIVTDALDDGLEARAMNEIAVQMRARVGDELSAGKSEDAAREMARERVRELKSTQPDEDENNSKPSSAPAGSTAHTTTTGKNN